MWGGVQARPTDFSTLPQVIPTSIPISIPNLSDFFDVGLASYQIYLSKTNGTPPIIIQGRQLLGSTVMFHNKTYENDAVQTCS